MSDAVLSPQLEAAPPLDWRSLFWVALAFAIVAAAIVSGVSWFLNFVHVMAGVLWTGIDLFMGFVVGPALHQTTFEARRSVVIRIMPKTIFLMPTLAITTATSGYFLAWQLGFLSMPYPAFYWVAASLVVITILVVQGLGILLPTNIRVYLELRKQQPDRQRLAHLTKRYAYTVTFQGMMQVTILAIMAKFATGL